MADFPPHGFKKEHSEFFKDSLVDETMTQEMEGGYRITRARTTRPPRRSFTTGWEILNEAEKVELQQFQESVGVSNLTFTYEHPTESKIFIVRFAERIQFSYIKNTKSWEAKNIVLIQA